MSDHDRWVTWLSVLDDVRPTPPDVRARIRRRVLAPSAETPDDPFASSPVHVEVVFPEEVAGDGGERSDPGSDRQREHRRRRRMAWALAAAAMVLAVVGVVGAGSGWWADSSDPQVDAASFPTAESEQACGALREATDDLRLLDRDEGSAVEPDQLERVATSFEGFVEQLRRVGFAADDRLRAWEQLVRDLNQAAVFGRGGQTAQVDDILDDVRFALADVVRSSSHPVVAGCFVDWPD